MRSFFISTVFSNGINKQIQLANTNDYFSRSKANLRHRLANGTWHSERMIILQKGIVIWTHALQQIKHAGITSFYIDHLRPKYQELLLPKDQEPGLSKQTGSVFTGQKQHIAPNAILSVVIYETFAEKYTHSKGSKQGRRSMHFSIGINQQQQQHHEIPPSHKDCSRNHNRGSNF